MLNQSNPCSLSIFPSSGSVIDLQLVWRAASQCVCSQSCSARKSEGETEWGFVTLHLKDSQTHTRTSSDSHCGRGAIFSTLPRAEMRFGITRLSCSTLRHINTLSFIVLKKRKENCLAKYELEMLLKGTVNVIGPCCFFCINHLPCHNPFSYSVV